MYTLIEETAKDMEAVAESAEKNDHEALKEWNQSCKITLNG